MKRNASQRPERVRAIGRVTMRGVRVMLFLAGLAMLAVLIRGLWHYDDIAVDLPDGMRLRVVQSRGTVAIGLIDGQLGDEEVERYPQAHAPRQMYVTGAAVDVPDAVAAWRKGVPDPGPPFSQFHSALRYHVVLPPPTVRVRMECGTLCMRDYLISHWYNWRGARAIDDYVVVVRGAREVDIPAWVLFPFACWLVIRSFAWRWLNWGRHRRPQDGTVPCPVCGYDLRATPGRCPECGTEVGRMGED